VLLKTALIHNFYDPHDISFDGTWRRAVVGRPTGIDMAYNRLYLETPDLRATPLRIAATPLCRIRSSFHRENDRY